MRLPPSVVSLIEAHLIPPPAPQIPKPSFIAFAANLQPLTPGSLPTSTSKSRNRIHAKPASPAVHATSVSASISKSASQRDPLPARYRTISVHGALERYPQNPSIALGAAHRLLDEQLSAPSTSSLVRNLIRRQQIYERIIRTFSQHPSTAQVTIASIYQRMIEEEVPPNTNILKIVLGTAIKNGTAIIPILRQLVGTDGLPEKMDIHLLVLIIRGIAREVVIKPKDLERVIDDCLTSAGVKGRPIEFDEILLESYGKKGDLKGIINLLSRHTHTHTHTTSRSAILSLHLQALTQWIETPLLRRKRRGSLFPRALAKDLISIYGGPEKMPLEWLNAWMNGERVAGNLETALNVWLVIASLPHGPDSTSYSTYLRLIKLLPTAEARSRLRALVKDLDTKNSFMDTNILEHALGAAFTHNDLPLVLFLARRLDYSPDQHHPNKLSATARMIDILAAGIVRLHRPPTSPNLNMSNGITPEEWRRITISVQEESRRMGTELNISLPLSTPQAGLVPDHGGGDYVGRYKPRSGTQTRASLVLPLIRILEEVVVHRYRVEGDKGGDEEIVKRVMMDLHAEILA